MTILEWNGEIGWELWQGKVKNDLKMSDGDITVRFSSIGGDIFEGADIITMLANHKKDNPNIKMNLELGGVAASMGSAIAASPMWDEVAVESLTAHMIHRPSSFIFGDFEDMKTRAEFLEKANNVYAKLYADKSGKPVEEIKTLMKNTTWLFGQEIVDNGFADKVMESDQQGDKDMILTGMKNKFSTMCANQKKINENESFDVVRAAACFKEDITMVTTSKPKEIEDNKNIKPDLSGKSKMEVPQVKDKKELKKELPEVYDEVLNDGVMKERESETQRRKDLAAMKAKDEYKNIPEVVAVIDKGIIEGEPIEEVRTMVNAALVTLLNKPGKIDEIESPVDITGSDQKPSMKAKDKIGEV